VGNLSFVYVPSYSNNVIMLEIIDFHRPTEGRKNLYITNILSEIAEDELTVNLLCNTTLMIAKV